MRPAGGDVKAPRGPGWCTSAMRESGDIEVFSRTARPACADKDLAAHGSSGRSGDRASVDPHRARSSQ